jgi:hypothetical protein
MPKSESEATPWRSFLTAESLRWVVVTLLIPFAGFVWNEVQKREVARQEHLEGVRADEQVRVANARAESDIVIRLMPALANKDEASPEKGIALAILLNLASREALSADLASAVAVAVEATAARVAAGNATEAEKTALSRIAAATDVASAGAEATAATRAGTTPTVAQEIVVQVPRVYIHIFDQTDRPRADALQKWIAYDQHWLAPGIENVVATAERRGGEAPAAPGTVEVRFFNVGDSDRAREVTSWLRGNGAPDTVIKKLDLKAPAGQLEVWFPRPR